MCHRADRNDLAHQRVQAGVSWPTPHPHSGGGRSLIAILTVNFARGAYTQNTRYRSLATNDILASVKNGGPLAHRNEQMWANVRSELREASWLAAMAFGLSTVCVGVAVLAALLIG